jgi:Tfp pilus assembly protein PilF
MIEDEFVPPGVPDLDDPLAAALEKHRDAAQSEEARAYLRERTRLARLQSENLIEQNAFEMSHLKWRRFADRVRGAGHAILVLLGVLVMVAIGAAVWSAATDHRLVVESFSVPPTLAEQGQTGTVIAQHVLDRIVAMQAGTQSLRAAKSYRNNWGDDLKVQIPETGISLSEAYRILVGWVGHQTRITGEVERSGQGLAVTARAGAGQAATFRGSNLDALLAQTAEKLFGDTQPYRYGIYLSSHGRENGAKAVLLALAQGDSPASERAWAYSGLLFLENDTRRAEQYGYDAIALNPDLLLAHNNLASAAWRLGHSEFFWRESATALRLLDENAGDDLDRRVLGNMRSVLSEEADAAIGDYAGAVREMQADLAAERTNRGRSQTFLVRDLALMHDPGGARRAVIDAPFAGNWSAANRQLLLAVSTRGTVDIESNDWSAAKAELSQGIKDLGAGYTSLQIQAPLAYVEARLGDIGSARALAARLPDDCYPCLIARAQVEAIAHNPHAAEALFAAAVHAAPSLPLAYADWGEMLLRRGDYDSAITKFAIAHQKGPYFADPLEMWGEALIQQNRSDLALAKFEEAEKYAPNWGRLHLEWGKALLYVGRNDEANKQFALASRAYLGPADAASLARAMAKHV